MTTETREITSSDDYIDVRDVIERVEYLETELESTEDSEGGDSLEREELATLTALLDDLRGNGGDHEWKGDWYPVSLIRQTYFQDYAQELAEDIGAIDKNAGWPLGYIDWEAAADALLMDYTSTEFEGITYYYR